MIRLARGGKCGWNAPVQREPCAVLAALADFGPDIKFARAIDPRLNPVFNTNVRRPISVGKVMVNSRSVPGDRFVEVEQRSRHARPARQRNRVEILRGW